MEKRNLHVLVKFNKDDYGHDTIQEHKKIISETGSVLWWNGGQISEKHLQDINLQIRNNETTHLYMKENSSSKFYFGRIKGVFTKPQNEGKIPPYVKAQVFRCCLFFEIDSIQLLEVIKNDLYPNQAPVTYVEEIVKEGAVNVCPYGATSEKEVYFTYKRHDGEEGITNRFGRNEIGKVLGCKMTSKRKKSIKNKKLLKLINNNKIRLDIRRKKVNGENILVLQKMIANDSVC